VVRKTWTFDPPTGNPNTFKVGSLAPATGGFVDNIKGPLVIVGSGADTLNLDDTGSASPKTGTLTESTLTGLGMGPAGITYSGVSALNISLGSGGNTFAITVSAGANLPATTTINGGPSSSDSLNASWAGDFNGILNLLAFESSTIMVAGNFNGTMSDTAPGTVQFITVDGSVTAPGSLLAGSIGTMTVGKDVAGTIQSLGAIGSLTIGSLAYAGSVTATGLVSVGANINTMLVYGNVAGIVQAVATINTMTVDGSVIPTPTAPPSGTITAGIIWAANINTLTVGGAMAGLVNVSANLNTMSVGQDMSGLINVGATLGQLTVLGGTPGSIVATTIGTVGTYGGYGPLVAQIKENGIQRRVEAAVPSTPYPFPLPLYSYPTSAAMLASPAMVNFQYFYEGLGSNNGTLANPQLTARITNTVSTAPDQYDLSLVTYNDKAKFNLARLDAAGIAGVRNVDVEGDILTKVTSAASTFFAPDSSPAGIYLPQDNLAGVGVRDYVPDHSINAKSIQALAFGSMTNSCGQIETGAVASSNDAANLLAPCTAIVQAGSINSSTVETFRVPFADLATQQVGFFMDDNPSSCGQSQFDKDNVVLEVQGVSTANSSGTANIVTPSNVARGAVVALITVAETFNSCNQLDRSFIENISLCGDGGSIQTQLNVGSPQDCSQPKTAFTPAITSTGPLGDVIIGGSLPNVTAPSIFGSILPCGSIPATSTIQTTGIRTDPITFATSQVPADIGRVYVTSTCKGPVVTATTVQANGSGLLGQIICDGSGLAGQIICGGNLISQVVANGITGVITVQPVKWEPGAGNLGATFTYPAPSKNVVYLGVVVSNGSMSGPTVVSSCLNKSTVTVNGLVQGGSITTYGSVIGNITINGSMNGPILATGNNSGTIDLNGTVQGGFITTYGSVIGNITICGQVNGPTLSDGSNNTTINVNTGASLNPKQA